VIDMVFNKSSPQKITELSLNLKDIVRRIAEEHTSLQELTKEYLGEEMSEDILKEVILQESIKEITNKLAVIINGK